VKIPVRKITFCVGIFVSTALVTFADSFPSAGPTTPGNEARLRGNVALAPVNAPLSVKRAIWAANQLRTKPYRYGGGHRSFHDSGYDCSGTISYALAAAGLVSVPLSSKELRAYGNRGRGKWITVYARNGHAFAVIAGLRLDTTSLHNRSRVWAPRWQAAPRMPFGFEARHPFGL
jgi:NlpC/P60 family